LLSVYEGLITNWELMKKDPAYSSVQGALDAGIALLGKYYDETDKSPLAVLSTVLDPATKNSYIKHFLRRSTKSLLWKISTILFGWISTSLA